MVVVIVDVVLVVGGGLADSSMSFNFTFIPLTNEVAVRGRSSLSSVNFKKNMIERVF